MKKQSVFYFYFEVEGHEGRIVFHKQKCTKPSRTDMFKKLDRVLGSNGITRIGASTPDYFNQVDKEPFRPDLAKKYLPFLQEK